VVLCGKVRGSGRAARRTRGCILWHGCNADRGAVIKRPARVPDPLACDADGGAETPDEQEQWDKRSESSENKHSLESIEDETIEATSSRGLGTEASPALVGVISLCVASAFL